MREFMELNVEIKLNQSPLRKVGKYLGKNYTAKIAFFLELTKNHTTSWSKYHKKISVFKGDS